MTVTTSYQGPIAVVSIDNPPVNALSKQLRQDLLDAVVRMDADPAVEAVVLSCEGRTFIAGADVKEFGKPPEAPHLPDVVTAIEHAEKPWVGAVHGNVLGGGLEIALGCTYRIAAPKTNFGLPEVKLGIIPGAGGTVRLPRLIGVEAAVDLATSGAVIGTEKAKAVGLIDAVVEGDLREGAVAFAQSIIGLPKPQPISLRAAPQKDGDFWSQAESSVRSKAKREVAPLRALASVRNATEVDFEAAMTFERSTFLDLRASDQAAALRHVFFAERAAPRPPELQGVPAAEILSAAVVGGGTMGAGIVAALRDAGLPVVLIERDAEAAERGLSNVRAIFDGAVKRGRLTAELAADRLAGVQTSTDYGALTDVDLVIEAVFEDLAVKQAVFAKLSGACRADAVLATNTSYLDPNQIGAGVKVPARFLGLHFFSPANVMKLLEIVPTATTSVEAVATGFALARLLGKIPVWAGICDGFIGNRILKVTRAQTERLLLSGATPSAIDAAMRQFGMPMGPFEAQDLGGLDIAAFQRRAARDRGEAVFAPIADKLCELGRFGQKTSGGWYDYAPGDRTPRPSDVVTKIIAGKAGDHLAGEWDNESLAEAIIFPMISEGAAILDEKVALRAADIDIVEIHGYGFPRWRGGLMHYGESVGLSKVVERLRQLSSKGLSAAPSQGLVRAAASDSFDG
ncbi:3-hydroxyacyl-CoA dehydrogenase NAD-binding domain-containing protein [Jiella sp. MQZ9-1]|uniref:Enoyl-CoA hydratase/isomerase family protein n=1 Tax=Jiella flava TaxID=2816857 RepID=A0A939JUS6_9HYPH|nr:3-hydroxyacyl-CoA dehydrogenase NAD-binding domain-containing protein [Jiella flava]MBO0661729.1 enoyl-CoA hydratase/isomerase family protein [Jiella flava]MCD2470371.1 3-hydroxyacyl-CoA dehydrogenase NAD-binding domain-containing protein [Jiella flava]